MSTLSPLPYSRGRLQLPSTANSNSSTTESRLSLGAAVYPGIVAPQPTTVTTFPNFNGFTDPDPLNLQYRPSCTPSNRRRRIRRSRQSKFDPNSPISPLNPRHPPRPSSVLGYIDGFVHPPSPAHGSQISRTGGKPNVDCDMDIDLINPSSERTILQARLPRNVAEYRQSKFEGTHFTSLTCLPHRKPVRFLIPKVKVGARARRPLFVHGVHGRKGKFKREREEEDELVRGIKRLGLSEGVAEEPARKRRVLEFEDGRVGSKGIYRAGCDDLWNRFGGLSITEDKDGVKE